MYFAIYNYLFTVGDIMEWVQIPMLTWSGVHFIFTVTTISVLIKRVCVEFIFFVVCEAIVIRFYTILRRVFCIKCCVMGVVMVMVVVFSGFGASEEQHVFCNMC